MKTKRTLSIDAETDMRLRQHAEARHTTVSQLITDWIWQTPLPAEQTPYVKEKNPQTEQILNRQ